MLLVVDTLGQQARIIWSVATRNAQLKHRESPIGVLSAVIEPLATIMVMTLAFSAIRLRVPDTGDYLLIFFMTGIIPISMFRGAALASERSFNLLRKTLVLPQLKPLDLMLGGLLLHVMVLVSLYILVTFFFLLVYQMEMPQNFVMSMVPLFINAIMGMGMGIINMTIKSFFKFWGTIFGIITAPLGICSGLFYTAATLPESVKYYLYWNPFLHSTEFVRQFYFTEYESTFFDPKLYFGAFLVIMFLGLYFERRFRSRLVSGNH